jgi:nicotinamide mononucleotide transporter
VNAIEWLESAPFSIAGAPVTWAELLGAVTGLSCVWLVARQNVWNWPLGLANNVFWALLFLNAKLYGDSVLQVVFFVLGCYGWWKWTHAGTSRRSELPIRRLARREMVWLGGLTAAATAGAATWLALGTDSPVPVADAAVLTLSLAATWGQAHKILESWWIWITVDAISVPLYVSRELYPTAAVYVVFGILCVKGLRAWSRSLAEAE